MSNPYFSVIIPAYNEENYIKSTLHSLKQQTFQDFETIVIANGCTDKTEEIIKKRTNEKLRLLSLANPNVSVARNAGALNSNGEMLIFLDADTILGKDTLQKIKENFSEQHSVATTLVNPDSKQLKFKFLMGLKNLGMRTKIYRGFAGIVVCPKKTFHKVGGYNPETTVKEHWDLRLKLEQEGKYLLVPSYTTTSMRRYQQWGLIKATKFWVNYLVRKKNGYEKIR